MAAGAKNVIVVSTHAVFSGPAVERLSNSVADEVIVTNTLPLHVEILYNEYQTVAAFAVASLLALFALLTLALKALIEARTGRAHT